MERAWAGLASSTPFVSTTPPHNSAQGKCRCCPGVSQEALQLRVVVSVEQTVLRDFSSTFASANEHVLFSWSILTETEV